MSRLFSAAFERFVSFQRTFPSVALAAVLTAERIRFGQTNVFRTVFPIIAQPVRIERKSCGQTT